MHKSKDLDCKVLSVMMRHLNILKYFSFGIESLWTRTIPVHWEFIDSDNLNVLTLKVKAFEIFIRLCNSTPR